MDRIPRRAPVPASTASETWHHQGPEVFVVRDGPAPDGTRYKDGRHSIRVAVFEAEEDAAGACKGHNAALQGDTWAYGGFCG